MPSYYGDLSSTSGTGDGGAGSAPLTCLDVLGELFRIEGAELMQEMALQVGLRQIYRSMHCSRGPGGAVPHRGRRADAGDGFAGMFRYIDICAGDGLCRWLASGRSIDIHTVPAGDLLAGAG